jgi:preprotein translocase subunit SecA
MFDFIGKTIAKIFGTKSERDIKEITPYVSLINEEYAKLAAISDDALRVQTAAVKKLIDDRLVDIDSKIAALHQCVADEPNLDIMQKEAIFNEIDELEKPGIKTWSSADGSITTSLCHCKRNCPPL